MGGDCLVSTWLHNNSVKMSIVTHENRDYLVYINTTGNLYPKLVEDIQTGKRITYREVSEELKQLNMESSRDIKSLDDKVKLMISKL